jgi:hypothetical protein
MLVAMLYLLEWEILIFLVALAFCRFKVSHYDVTW